MIFTRVLGDVRNILVCLAGDIEAVLAEHLLTAGEFKAIFEYPANNVNEKWRPSRRRFDEAETQSRELLGYSVGDQIAKCQQRHHPRVAEGVVAREIEHLQYLLHTATGVHAD